MYEINLGQRGSAGNAQDLTVDVARLLGGQEDVGGGKLGWLCGAPHRRLLLTELGDKLGGHGGRNEQGPHRTRATTFTRTPCWATSMASPLVKFTMAAFV